MNALPAFDAAMNGVSALSLLTGWRLIRRGRREAHRRAMLTALGASTLFLIGYLAHHARAGVVPFRGVGLVRLLYFSILIPHTILAMVILPLVVMTVLRAARGRFDAHRRLARITLPLWLFVSVTGVLVYLMLYQWPIPAASAMR
jgi:protein SCO1/2/putative membrane protein